MAGNSDWLAGRLADQADMFQNVNNKIEGCAAALGLTPAQVTAIELICTEFEFAYSLTEESRLTTLALVQWRDQIFNGSPKGAPAVDPPQYTNGTVPVGSKIGIIAQFRDLRDIILAAPGYTDAIGSDLGIVGSGGAVPPPPEDATPVIKTQVGSGYEVSISGAMRGMDALRVEWQPNGGTTWSLVGFLTRTPGVVIISPNTPGQPESGQIRARYILNNSPIGSYSQAAAVTVSA